VCFVSDTGWSPANIPVVAHTNCLTTTVSQRVSSVVFDSLQPITSCPREQLAATLTPCSMIENVACQIEEIGVLWGCFLMLAPLPGYL
jgi:hypothetical protein